MALTANASVKSKGEGGVVAFDVAASAHVYRGGITGVVVASGFVGPAAAITANVRTGIAREEVDNSTGTAGAKSVEVYTEGEFLLTGSGFAQTDVGKAIYATADDVITLASGTGANLLLGTVTKFVSATQVWVRLLPFGVVS